MPSQIHHFGTLNLLSEGDWKTECGKGSLTSLFLPKSRAQISHEKDTLPLLDRKFLSLEIHSKHWNESAQTKLLQSPLFSINFLHILPSHFPTIYGLEPKPLFLWFWHITIYHSFLKWYISSKTCLLFWVFISYIWRPPCTLILTANKICVLFSC